MRSKRNKPKKYVGGGMIALQAAMGGVQYLHGRSQRNQAQAEYERIKSTAPSLDTPSQYYENYKNAYDNALAEMETDSINRAYATSLSALQSAGGRAVVGGLGAINQQRQAAQNTMAQQERTLRAAAGQDLARAQESEQARRIEQTRLEMAQADAAFQAGTQNMGRAITGAATNIAYTSMANQMYGTGDTEDTNEDGGGSSGREAVYDERDFEPGGSRYNSGLNVNLPNWVKKAGNAVKNAYLGNFNSGGMVTPGEFSHKRNPIDIVKNGEKIGEATGNEIIINPEQQKEIAKQSSYAKKLFIRFAQNAKNK